MLVGGDDAHGNLAHGSIILRCHPAFFPLSETVDSSQKLRR